jgi:hypothetical protein
MLFAFEPPGPSRRVRVHWDRMNAGALRRFFGPGLMKTSVLLTLLGIFGMVALAFVDVASLEMTHPSATERMPMQIFVVGFYGIAFTVFVIGLCAWLRSRGNSPWITRLIHGGILFVVAAGPWAVAAIGGVLSHAHDAKWIAVAAPSPFYVFAMTQAVNDVSDMPTTIIPVGIACALGWGALGLSLLAAAGVRSRRTVLQHEALIAQADAALNDEEARAQCPPEGAGAPHPE